MEVTKIYGASDDLIGIEGQIPMMNWMFTWRWWKYASFVSDGTKGLIKYDDEGHGELTYSMPALFALRKSHPVGDDAAHLSSERMFGSYSDVLILGAGELGVKIGKRKFKRKWVHIPTRTLNF